MVEMVKSVLWFLGSLFKPRSRLVAEVLVLRHQLGVLHRKSPGRGRLSAVDRLLLAWIYRLWPDLLGSIVIVRPETVVRWHRRGFKAFWRWKSRSIPGRPAIPKEIRNLIREISLANPLWGAPRIHGELRMLGIEGAQSTVAQYMARGQRPPSPSSKTFLQNHANGIASIDLFVVPTGTFKLLFGLLILRHDRRRLIHSAVTEHPIADGIAHQVSEAFPWETAPEYLIRDRDGAYGEVFRRRPRSMGIRDRPTAPRSPWQNSYVERLIGSVRRECLDHMIVFNEGHLRRVLRDYADYYNEFRTHLWLGKNTPNKRPVCRTGKISPLPQLGGLHHAFVRI